MQAATGTRASRAVLLGLALFASSASTLANETQDPAPGAEASAPTSAPLADDDSFRVYWKNSINFETGDKKFKFKLGGRLQNDWWFIANQSDGLKTDLAGRTPPVEQTSGTDFRRARIYMSGTLYENMVFKWAYDFAGGTPDFKDAYLGWKNVPGLGLVLVGQQKEPIGFEFAYSSNYETFIERGLPHYLNPERSTGVRFYRNAANEAVYLTAGAFKPSDTQGDSTSLVVDTGDAWAFSGRVAGSPIYKDKGERLLHLGLNGSYRTGIEAYAKGARPEVNGMARYVTAAVTNVDEVTIGGLELAANLGPLSVQGEYVVQNIGQAGGESSTWSGWYGYVSYFLTGEHRPYTRKSAAYTGVTPKHALGENGSGAWEIGLRYSSLDLADSSNTATSTSGELNDITGGVNWYMNYNTRIMLNYVHADLEGVGTSDAIAMRFQVFL